MTGRRVVVTGLGMVTPLACGVEATWQRILEGQSGAATIGRFDASHLKTNYACEIPVGEGEGDFNPDDWMAQREQKKVDDFILYAISASDQAIQDAEWQPQDEEGQDRTGVMIGSGIGGLSTISQVAKTLSEQGPRRISPFFIPSCLINLASGHVSIRYQFRGPNHASVTACATGTHVIGDATRLIAIGDADVMVAGGAESPVCELGVAGFNACKALSTQWRDEPQRASRPFDSERDGFVMGEGAGMVVLEERQHAMQRGARIYAEIIGYGLSGDAYHITAPAPDGSGGRRAMKMAIDRAQILPEQLSYINAHGTSTMADPIEISAIGQLVGRDHIADISISSTKSATGHLLGAAGAIETIFCILAIRDQVAPPTINLENPVVESIYDLTALEAKSRQVQFTLSNSFGFGGSNASLLLARDVS